MKDKDNFKFVLDELVRMQKQINETIVELHKNDVIDTETARRLIRMTEEENK